MGRTERRKQWLQQEKQTHTEMARWLPPYKGCFPSGSCLHGPARDRVKLKYNNNNISYLVSALIIPCHLDIAFVYRADAFLYIVHLYDPLHYGLNLNQKWAP